jgi:hypothetical protein
MTVTPETRGDVARLGGADAVEVAADQSTKKRLIGACLILFVFAVVVSVVVYDIGDLGKYQEHLAIQESQAALQGITDPDQINVALRQYPSNRYLKLVAMAASVVAETDAASEKLSKEVEPPALAKDINLSAASRSDLEALNRDLKTAEVNATTFMPRYTALFRAEREKLENYARSLHPAGDFLKTFLEGVDRWQAETTDLASKTLAARGEFYRAYGKCVQILLSEFGRYNVANGQFIFPFQSTADRYNAAAGPMSSAAKRIAELQEERKMVVQSQLKRWLHVVDSGE